MVELKLSNGLIIYIDRIIIDPYDNSRYLLFHNNKEIGRWYKDYINDEDLRTIKDFIF